MNKNKYVYCDVCATKNGWPTDSVIETHRATCPFCKKSLPNKEYLYVGHWEKGEMTSTVTPTFDAPEMTSIRDLVQKRRDYYDSLG